MRNFCCAIIIVSLLISLQLIGFAAPSVEGVMGVPWGTSREQVDKAMAEQGFIRIANRIGVPQFQPTLYVTRE